MTAKEALEVVQRITYKPGFSITAEERGDSGIEVHFSMVNVPNAVDKGYTLTLTFSQVFWVKDMDEDYLLKAIYQLLLHGEKHELLEWYRVDGKQWQDPHAGGAKGVEG